MCLARGTDQKTGRGRDLRAEQLQLDKLLQLCFCLVTWMSSEGKGESKGACV